jgi:hypothetical protein
VRSSTNQGSSGTVFSIFIPLDPGALLESRRPSLLQGTGSD